MVYDWNFAPNIANNIICAARGVGSEFQDLAPVRGVVSINGNVNNNPIALTYNGGLRPTNVCLTGFRMRIQRIGHA